MAKTTISVSVKDGNVEKAISSLKTKVARGGTLSKLKERKFYESRNKRRKKQAQEAARKSRRVSRREAA
jgi:small subunit ribosomal protein S21